MTQPPPDLLLVYSVAENSAETQQRRTNFVERVLACGLNVDASTSRDNDEVLLSISTSELRLERMAEEIQMEKKLLSGGYADYSNARRLDFQPASYAAFFTSLERQRLLLSIIDDDPLSRAMQSFETLDCLIEDKVLKTVVPLHDPSLIEGAHGLMSTWVLSRRWWLGFDLNRSLAEHSVVPLDGVRDYFGEKVGFYFAFLESTTRDLLVPAVLGLLMWLVGWAYGSEEENPLLPLYSVCVLLWATWLVQNWRRQEMRLAHRWNVTDFEEEEKERHEFRGELAPGFYTDEGYFVELDDTDGEAPRAKRFTMRQRLPRLVVSSFVVAPLVVALLSGALAIIALKNSLAAGFYWWAGGASLEAGKAKLAVSAGSAIGGAIFAVYVEMTNVPLSWLAEWLTAQENHRTPTAHEDALILKTCVFHFTNAFAALVYTAFVKASGSFLFGDEQYCHDATHYGDGLAKILSLHRGVNPFCMAELATLLSSLVLTSQLTAHAKDFVVPRAAALYAIEKETFELWRRRGLSSGDAAWAVVRRAWYTERAVGGLARATGHEPTRIWQTIDEKAAKNGLRIDVESGAGLGRVGGLGGLGGASVPPLGPLEAEAKLEAFVGVGKRYSTVTLQLGYVILFAPAFPLGALVCYLSSLLRLRSDGYMLLRNTRRLRYAGAEDIGSWRTVLLTVTMLGVVTNVGMVGLTMPQLQPLLPTAPEARLLLLVVVEHALLVAQQMLRGLIPHVPRDLSVQRALARRTHLATRVVRALADNSEAAAEARAAAAGAAVASAPPAPPAPLFEKTSTLQKAPGTFSAGAPPGASLPSPSPLPAVAASGLQRQSPARAHASMTAVALASRAFVEPPPGLARALQGTPNRSRQQSRQPTRQPSRSASRKADVTAMW